MVYVATFILSTAIIYQVHGQTCSWNFTQPSDVTVEYVIESGESATFNVLVIGEVITNADRVTWKYNGTDIALLRYTSTGTGDFVEQLSNPRGIATYDSILPTINIRNECIDVIITFDHSSERNNHSLIIPSINETDDGAQIYVISGGCTVNDVSPIITLRVLPAYTTVAPSTATNGISTDTTLGTESGIATTATSTITTAEISTTDVTWTSTGSVVSTTDNIVSTDSSSVTDTGGFLTAIYTTRGALNVTDTTQSENSSLYESTIAINQSVATSATQDANGNGNAVDDRPWWFVLVIVLPIFALLLASVAAVAAAHYYKCCCFKRTSKVSDAETASREDALGTSEVTHQTD